MAARKPLEFWFDFASTYSYVAAMRIEELCRAGGVELRWSPFLLGPIFALQGWNDSPFNLNARRGDYMWRDLERLTGKFGLEWRRPTVFPRASTLAARVACVTSDERWCAEFIRAVFVENFGHDRDIADPSLLGEILNRLGQSGEDVLARAGAPEHRGLLRANTERAIALGLFGAPNCVVGGEIFWGEEALDDAIAWTARP